MALMSHMIYIFAVGFITQFSLVLPEEDFYILSQIAHSVSLVQFSSKMRGTLQIDFAHIIKYYYMHKESIMQEIEIVFMQAGADI